MKTWRKKYEWTIYSACANSELHTAEYNVGDISDPCDQPGNLLNESEFERAVALCGSCRVRPECIEWALSEKACGVIVAGLHLPDPFCKKELKEAYAKLRELLPSEKVNRGEEI